MVLGLVNNYFKENVCALLKEWSKTVELKKVISLVTNDFEAKISLSFISNTPTRYLAREHPAFEQG